MVDECFQQKWDGEYISVMRRYFDEKTRDRSASPPWAGGKYYWKNLLTR